MNINNIIVLILHTSNCLGLNYMKIAQISKKKSGIIDIFPKAGVFFCAKTCKQRTSCTSFNFHRGDLVCELVGENGKMTDSERWIHIDNPDDVHVRTLVTL